MNIKNTKNTANYVNFKDNGIPRKVIIPGGQTIEIKGLNEMSQIFNLGDFKRGFFEIVSENKDTDTKILNIEKKTLDKNKFEDSLQKIEEEVKNYTDKEK